MRIFLQVLVNTAAANITTSFLWFALTFWAYLETQSVLATGVIGGAYMLLIALFGMLFGTLVDRHRKHRVMVLSAFVTLAAFLIAGALWVALGEPALIDLGGPWFWIFSSIILLGAVVENLRSIALSTTVTLLVPVERHANANGLVGTVQGVAFMVTSVFSGLAIGLLGMGWTLAIAIVLTIAALVHLLFIRIPETGSEAPTEKRPLIDFRGSVRAVAAVSGLFALILFSTLNNLIGGVYMALMDPYGLTLFPVEWWGVVLGITATGFIIGGAFVAKFGLGRNPIRTMLIFVIVMGVLGSLFTIRECVVAVRPRDLALHVHHPGRRGIRADRHPEGRAVRDPGPRVRVRAGVRGRRGADHGVPHRPDRPVLDHPLHGLGCRSADVGVAPGRGRGPRDRAGVLLQRARHGRPRADRVHDARVPHPVGGVRAGTWVRRDADAEGRGAPADVDAESPDLRR